MWQTRQDTLPPGGETCVTKGKVGQRGNRPPQTQVLSNKEQAVQTHTVLVWATGRKQKNRKKKENYRRVGQNRKIIKKPPWEVKGHPRVSCFVDPQWNPGPLKTRRPLWKKGGSHVCPRDCQGKTKGVVSNTQRLVLARQGGCFV